MIRPIILTALLLCNASAFADSFVSGFADAMSRQMDRQAEAERQLILQRALLQQQLDYEAEMQRRERQAFEAAKARQAAAEAAEGERLNRELKEQIEEERRQEESRQAQISANRIVRAYKAEQISRREAQAALIDLGFEAEAEALPSIAKRRPKLTRAVINQFERTLLKNGYEIVVAKGRPGWVVEQKGQEVSYSQILPSVRSALEPLFLPLPQRDQAALLARYFGVP